LLWAVYVMMIHTIVLLHAENCYSTVTYMKTLVFFQWVCTNIMRGAKLCALISVSFCNQRWRSVSITCFSLMCSIYNNVTNVTSWRAIKSSEAHTEVCYEK
jgi:hypothetical protein